MYLLEILLGRVDAVTVEVVDSQSDLVEFLVRRGEDEEGHQEDAGMHGVHRLVTA